MSVSTEKTYTDFVLPLSVVSRLDVARLVREFEQVDNELTALAVRTKVAAPTQPTPVLSEQLREFIEENNLTLDESGERTRLVKQLRLLKDASPTVHMTFASVVDRESLQQIAKWLRESVHPQAIITVGLQPGLVGGVYMRTPNHVHDFSMRGQLERSRGVLIKELEALRAHK